MDCTLQDDLSPLHNLSKIILHPLNGPVIEFRLGRDFSSVQTGPGAHPASCTMAKVSVPGEWVEKRPGRGVNHPPQLLPRLQKE